MKKKVILFTSIIAAVFAMSSCDKSFIDTSKPYSLTEDIVFADAQMIENNLLGCYNAFKSSNPTFMDGLGFVVFDNRGDDVVNVSNPVTMQETYEMRVSGISQENGYIWDYAYYAINCCNIFIDKIVEYKCVENKVLTEAQAAQFTAEAKFLRAYSYYVLCQLYSEPYCINPDAPAVPLRLTGLTSSGNNDCPRSTIKQIYDQILSDCIPADLLDEPGTYSGVSRASQAAAHLLRMRVYMAEQNWDNAITEGNAIKGYQLVDDVTSLYGYPVEHDVYSGKEMIFALPNTKQDSPNTQMSAAEYFNSSANVAWLNTESGILSQEAYSLPSDARVMDLIEGPNSKGYYFSAKYQDYGGHCDWVPLMRFAEVELNLAECYVNVAGGTDAAKEHLTNVRSRAIPFGDILDIESMGAADLKTAVYNERRLEFLCEGMRGIDIMRRGESFVKETSLFSKTCAPGTTGYVWPIPDKEYTYNKAL